MRNAFLKKAIVCTACVIVLFACRKNGATEQVATPSEEALDKIHNLGFSNKNVTINEYGNYIVEGDIVLSEMDLDAAPDRQFLRVGAGEQYHTHNLVRGLPRVIKLHVAPGAPSSLNAALDQAIMRYNMESLRITFQRIATGTADISIVNGGPGNGLAIAGFPTSTGNPYGIITTNFNAMGNLSVPVQATVLAHELGHCIGFRHTDYMNTAYSCGGQAVNEGASPHGAIHIPGTPAGPNINSWMLACIGSGQNRPFNSNDKTALSYLY